jgi:CBS domain-containing protein
MSEQGLAALEHTLIMLLLLVGLLKARPRLHWAARAAIAAGVLLALLAPARPVPLPWDILAALIIPILFWQTARWVASAFQPVDRLELGLWAFVAVGTAGALSLASAPGWPGALLFGLLAASMLWHSLEGDRPSVLGQAGPLALALLLAEIIPEARTPAQYGLALAIGAAAGSVIGYAAMRAAERLRPGWQRGALGLVQVYAAYVTGALFGGSAVVAAALAVAVFVAGGARRGLWSGSAIEPRPLNSPAVFTLAVAALAFFGWQSHVPLTPVILVEALLGLAVAGVAVAVGKWRSRGAIFARESPGIPVGRIGLLLLPALLLWPRAALLDPVPLALAVVAAVAVSWAARAGLDRLLNLYAWLDEAGLDVERPSPLAGGYRAADHMTKEVISVSPEAPIVEVARLIVERRIHAVPVVEAGGQILGVITEADLFVKEEPLPRSGRSYPALFKEPVGLRTLPEAYAEIGARYRAADVMSQNPIWLSTADSLERAIGLMIQHGIRWLPVLTAAPGKGGRVVGVLTRGDIVRLLAGSSGGRC